MPDPDDDTTPIPVAIIGLGLMGAALARAQLDAGVPVAVWNRSAARAAPFHETSARVCTTAREAVEASEIILVCLSGYDAWNEVVAREELEPLLAGRTLVQLGTGTREQARTHAARFRRCGAGVVDGVILALPSQIGSEQAMLLVAGEAESWAACAASLEFFGSIRYLGADAGAPCVLEAAILSSMLGALVGTIHGAALAEAGGVPLHELAELLAAGQHLQLEEMLRVCEAIATDHTEATEAALGTWARLPEHMLELARSGGTDPAYPQMLQTLFDRATAAGLADHDLSALIQLMRARH